MVASAVVVLVGVGGSAALAEDLVEAVAPREVGNVVL